MIKELDLKSTVKSPWSMPKHQFAAVKIISPILGYWQAKEHTATMTLHYDQQFPPGTICNVTTKLKLKYPKLADVLHVYIYYDLWCVSSKFKEVFEARLKGCRFYPTNFKGYWLFLVDNMVDLLDREKTDIVLAPDATADRLDYQYIENEVFKPEAEEEYVFQIPELATTLLCSSRFEAMLLEHGLIGLQVYKDLGFKRKNRKEDIFRRASYDEEGNMIAQAR